LTSSDCTDHSAPMTAMSLLQHVLQVAHKEQRHHSQYSYFTIHYVMNVIQVALLTCHSVTLNRWQSG